MSYVNIKEVLGFEELFPNEYPLSIREYLKGGTKNKMLDIASYFLGSRSFDSKFNDNKKIIEIIFGNKNNEFSRGVYLKIAQLGSNKIIINRYSSLMLFEYFFQLEIEENVEHINPDFEINLFKAYLVINSEFNKKYKTAISSVLGLDSELKAPMMLFCMTYPVADKTNFEIIPIWITEFIKAIYFFQFLENNTKTKIILSKFLNNFDCLDWQIYLKKYLPLTLPAADYKNDLVNDIVVEKNEDYISNINFINKLSIQYNDELINYDFLTLRSKPIYEIEPGKYRIIFNLFVVEKIYKGLYFMIKNLNEEYLKNNGINLKSIIGLEFSEQILLSRALENIYIKAAKVLTGKELDGKIPGFIDYYLRQGNNILLFESKDFLITAEKKLSFDYKIYEKEFEKILYFTTKDNGKEKPKAILQLINFIRKLFKKEFLEDNDFVISKVKIFPILIIHDRQFDVPGFNFLLNHWFQEELEILQEEGFKIKNVNKLIVVNIDSLLYHQVGLRNKIHLHELLVLYTKFISQQHISKFMSEREKNQKEMDKLIPFSTFINNYFRKHKLLSVPPIVKSFLPVLFADQDVK